jgi:hypothetical protein
MRASLVTVALGVIGISSAAAQQVTDLPQALLPLSGSEIQYIIQNGVSKQITIGNIISGSGGCPLTGCTFGGPVAFGGNAVTGFNFTIGGGSINGTAIGNTTPATGTFSVLVKSTAIVSAAGTSQPTATALTAQINDVTGGSNGQGVRAWGTIGAEQTIVNRMGSALLLYPAPGAAFETNGSNNPMSIPVNGMAHVLMVNSTQGIIY